MKTRILSGLMVVLLALSGWIFAQTSNGTISGTVTDQTSSVVIGATVTAKSLDTGVSYTATTTSVGAFRIESVLPGNYTITVTGKGFAATKITPVAVAASIVTAVNPVLKPGNVENIEVYAGAETIQTESGDVTATIPEKVVTEVPISSGNPYALATTLPGVTTVTAAKFTNGTAFAVNGTRPRANNFLIEGQDNNDAGLHGQGMQPGNTEAVKEVIVMQNSYAAEFGHGGGSVSNIIYKSGSNRFHGTVWDRLLNSSLEANDHNNNIYGVEKSKYRENVFGFNVSGPIVKNKLFFFGSYQWDKYRTSQSGGNITIPTAAGLAVLQQYSATNTRIANYLKALGGMVSTHPTVLCSATAAGNLGLDPTTNINRGCVELGTYARTGIAAKSESPELDLKGDYFISPKDTLSLRYIKTHYETPYDLGNFPSQFPGFDAMQSGNAHNAGLTYIHTFTTSLVNEFRFSYGRIGFTFDNRPDTWANPLATAPTISISGVTGYGANGSVPQGRFHNTYQTQDSLAYNVGRHQFKFGFDIADIRVRDGVPFNFYGSLGYTSGGGYTGLGNYMDDYSGAGSSTATRAFGSNTVRPEMISKNYFIQDTWKVTQNLTLVLGLRYENNGTPANVLPFPALNPATYWSLGFPTRTPQVADSSDWGPRLGIAYTPHFWKPLFGEGKTVLRAGYGIFYDGIFTNILDNTVASSPNNVTASTTGATTNRGTASWSTYIPTTAPVLAKTNAVVSMDSKLLSPVTYQWNVDIQRELSSTTSLTATYVGTRGLHLFAQDQLNPTTGKGQPRLHSTFGSVVFRDNQGDSMYHALQLNLQRRLSHGLLFRAAYTWSKMMDDVSEIFTTGNWSAYPALQWGLNPGNRHSSDWGRSVYDHRQAFVVSYVYDIPKLKGDSFAMKPVKAVLNGWQISGVTRFQAGTPYNVVVGYDTNYDGISNDRPVMGNKNAPLTSWAVDQSWANKYLNIATPGTVGVYCDGLTVFSSRTCGTPVDPATQHWLVKASGIGNVQRNSQTSPGLVTWDFSLQRTIKLHEGHGLDIRAEMFNIFNHANEGVPVSTLTATGNEDPRGNGNSQFGNTSMTATGGRSIRMLFRYTF